MNNAYRRAEKKIAATMLNGANELELNSMLLTELPESLKMLPRLQYLYLTGNKLQSLPEWITQFSHLRVLDVSENELKHLPESLDNLTHLRRFNISNNDLTTLPESLNKLTNLNVLNASKNKLSNLPVSVAQYTELYSLNISANLLTVLPEWLGVLTRLQDLNVSQNKLTSLPESIGQLTKLEWLDASVNELTFLPDSLGRLYLNQIRMLFFYKNQLTDLPPSLAKPELIRKLELQGNPLNPELSAAYKADTFSVVRYLRAKADKSVVLNEAKLIFVGEGGVGKSSLLAALRNEPWVEKRNTTHGVETKTLLLSDDDINGKITFNSWDFGGQPVYRPTHQLFFTAPAIYIAVWDPRRGPEQSCVQEWIKMVKQRTCDDLYPDQNPRVLVVATNGGPKERRDHIDNEGLKKQFSDLIVGFYHVDSFTGYGLKELKKVIFNSASCLPNVGRSVPASWARLLEGVRTLSKEKPYIRWEQFEELCVQQTVESDLIEMYAKMMNELGHLIYYRNHFELKDTVILKGDWLSKAISFVLEDHMVDEQSGLVDHQRLTQIWDDPDRPDEERYPAAIHPVFLRLMERFELSYRIMLPEQTHSPHSEKTSTIEAGTSLIAQLVPGKRPDHLPLEWPELPQIGDAEKVQICQLIDKTTGQNATANGLLYRLIVRFHRYSLGRENYHLSCHWQKGILIDDRYNGRALIEEIGGNIRVTVRAAYPDRLLHFICEEVKSIADQFWKGLKCKVMVPCLPPCQASLDIEALIQARLEGEPKYPCTVCMKWHSIDALLSTAAPMPEIGIALKEIKAGQDEIRNAVNSNYQSLSVQLRILMSQSDEQYAALIETLTDEAKEGPCLFSISPVDRSGWNPIGWVKKKFRVTLWCEHTRMPLPLLNKNNNEGVYDFDVTREWFAKAAPFLKVLTESLSLVLPMAASATKLVLNDATYKAIEKQLDFGKSCAEGMLNIGNKSAEWMNMENGINAENRGGIRAQGGVMREFQAWLREADPSYGDLRRVQNKRMKFLWVHRDYEGEY